MAFLKCFFALRLECLRPPMLKRNISQPPVMLFSQRLDMFIGAGAGP
jgi:hypothetical protein